jgi:hypothetical protein
MSGGHSVRRRSIKRRSSSIRRRSIKRKVSPMRRRSSTKHSSRNRKIYKGSRGGRYYMRKGRKVYI